jgi:hypothetical protein
MDSGNFYRGIEERKLELARIESRYRALREKKIDLYVISGFQEWLVALPDAKREEFQEPPYLKGSFRPLEADLAIISRQTDDAGIVERAKSDGIRPFNESSPANRLSSDLIEKVSKGKIMIVNFHDYH